MAKRDMIETKAAFIRTFIEKLGDVADWDHNGDVEDYGVGSKEKCVCGHPIRYGYIIVNSKTGKKSKVGSECINHFQGYNLSLYNSLINTIARLKKEEKEAKEALMNEEVLKVSLPYEEKVQKIWKFYNDNYGGRFCSNYELWYAVANVIRLAPKKAYKNKKSLINWYKLNEKKVDYILNNHCR